LSRVLFVEPLLDAPNSAIAARGGDLLPLSHGLPRHARIIAADIAALRTCEELLGCRGDVGETCIMHGLSQAQRVIRNLHAIKETCGVRQNSTRPYTYTHIFCPPQLSRKQLGAAFPFLVAEAFRLGRWW
jgi:hypothetical protein